tara:strand:- start:4161 stop:4958 length:798 start_codon:yes stop_codon:yes gene_type:complete
MEKANIQNILFPVKEVPAIWKDKKNGNILNKNTGHKFIIREDTEEILSCMTDNYQLVDNNTIFEKSDKLLSKQGGKIKEVKAFGKGARTLVKYEFGGHKVKISKDDYCTPEVIWQNSYDGTVGLNILAGAFRLVCTNGLVIGIVAEKYRNKHSIYNMELNDIEGIIEETINKTKQIMTNEFPVLHSTKVKNSHIVDILKMFPIGVSDYITGLLIAENPQNLWNLINVATNVATHGMDRKSEATHKLESKIYSKVCKMAGVKLANA